MSHRRHKLISHGTALKIGPRGTVKDPRVNIACKCEKFTEAEITEAIHPHPPAYINLLANRAVNAGSVTLLVPSGTLRKLQSFNAKPFDVFK